MKKWLILLAVVAVIGGVWYYVSNYVRYTPIWFKPKFGTVSHGDIHVPITATGLIEPNQRIEVKSKASGEVIERPVDEGDFVRAGDTLLVLKRDDEQRNFNGAQAELARANALHEQAKVAVRRARANILGAQAEVQRLKSACAMSEFELEKIKRYRERGDKTQYSDQEFVNAEAQHNINVAQKASAEARLEAARCAELEARETVKLQEAAVWIAELKLGTAQERLDETTIVAKYDALVTDVRVKPSEVILSGTASITGGTIVMYLADVSTKKVIARVDESDYGRVMNISPLDALPEMPGLREAVAANVQDLERRSGRVRLTVDAFPEDVFEGVIERVEPQGKLNQGSAVIQYDVHVVLTGPDAHKLPLGAQAQVEFTVESATNTLRVPAEAVKTYQGERGVYIEVPPEPGSNDKWGKKFVPCRFGITDGEFTQVIEVQGDEVLEDGMKLYTKLPVDRHKDED